MDKTVIDISRFNIISDYAAVAANVDGIIMRCAFRGSSSGLITEDVLFSKHIENFAKLNKPVGIYFFDAAINEEEAKEEADYALNIAKKYKLSFPIIIDTEFTNQKNHTGRCDNLSVESRTNNIIAFCEEIKKYGCEPAIYSFDTWFEYNLDYSKVSKYKIWVARTTEPKIVKNYIGWQYGAKNIEGAPKAIDHNHWYAEIDGVTEDTTDTNQNSNETSITKGQQINLVKTALYSNSTTPRVATYKTGTYFIWSTKIINGRIRITNKFTNLGNTSGITGWINVSDIK